jgi:hypothetical protein
MLDQWCVLFLTFYGWFSIVYQNIAVIVTVVSSILLADTA